MNFYHAMVRKSAVILRYIVLLSVMTLRHDHIHWNLSKMLSRLISLGHMIFGDPNIMGLLQGEHHQILARMGCGMEKWLLAYKSCNITEMAECRKLLLTANIKSCMGFRLPRKLMTLNDL